MKRILHRSVVWMLSLVFALACFTTAMAEAKENLIYAQSIAITSLDPAGMQPQGYPAGYEAAFAIHNGLVRFAEDLSF